MSYANFDHADWVQRQIAPEKRWIERRKRRDNTKGWAAAPEELNGFQRKVMDIIGLSLGGIYNAPIAWDAVRWTGWGRGIAVPVRHDLATFDGCGLTLLVLACHEARIRLEIRPHGFGHLLLCFWPRTHEGSTSSRHPNIDEAVEAFRNYVPADHRIIYRADQ